MRKADYWIKLSHTVILLRGNFFFLGSEFFILLYYFFIQNYIIHNSCLNAT